MAKEFPRLSIDLPYVISPVSCQACGVSASTNDSIRVWNEHDDYDLLDKKHYVALCKPCSDQIIEPHPRFYSPTTENAPLPGVMEVCQDCRFRKRMSCTSPQLFSNGGEGLSVKHSPPWVAMVDGTVKGRRCGWTVITYAHPPTCEGYEQGEFEDA